jgi:hypothetical protein
VVIFILEKTAKILFKISGVLLALFGIKYLLSFLGVIIPLEWFIIMGCGMLGMYGLIVILMYIFIIKLL